MSGVAASDPVQRFERLRLQALRAERVRLGVSVLVASVVLFASFHISDFFSPSMGADPLGRIAVFVDRMTPNITAEAAFADRATRGSIAAWYYDFPRWIQALWETLQMAVVGTFFGAICAAVAAFFSARNVLPLAAPRFVLRRFLELLRTMPDLILAIIFSAAFGLGAVAGVITLIVTTTGSLGKLFGEAIEGIDMRPVEAMKASGAGWLAQMRYGVLPQVAPNFASYGLLRLEINLSVAAALGIVGAGGIGVELQRAITYTEFDTYLALLLMIAVSISIIDMASEVIRHRLIGVEAPA